MELSKRSSSLRSELEGPTIEINGLTKRFDDDVVAVDDASFTVHPGRVTGLIGRNGAGKTTLMKSLLGLTRPTAGSALIGGVPIDELPNAPTTIGAALVDMQPIVGATGRRELRVWARALGQSRERVEEVLNVVGLESDADRDTKDYSTGMRQRLSIGVALLCSPSVLILDEPTTGLDPDGHRWIRQLIRDHADRGGTVLVSSHQLAELQMTVDDIIILDQSVRFAGTVDELLGDADLETRFFEIVEGAA